MKRLVAAATLATGLALLGAGPASASWAPEGGQTYPNYGYCKLLWSDRGQYWYRVCSV